MPESWTAISFKKMHEELGLQVPRISVLGPNPPDELLEKSNDKNTDNLDKHDSDKITMHANVAEEVISVKNQEPCDNNLSENAPNQTNAFMRLTYGQKDVCVGDFWEVFCQEAENQGISAASFATYLGARAAIPGPSAGSLREPPGHEGEWGQFTAGNRSVLDMFRKLRFGKFNKCECS